MNTSAWRLVPEVSSNRRTKKRDTFPFHRRLRASVGKDRGKRCPRQGGRRSRGDLGQVTGPEPVQIVGPRLHHQFALGQERRAVVGPAVPILHRVGQLVLDEVWP